eukprot:gene20614-33707_t
MPAPGRVDAVDVNLGCPGDNARKGGYGAWLLPPNDEGVVAAAAAAAARHRVAVTCKLRLHPGRVWGGTNGVGLLHGRLREGRGERGDGADWGHSAHGARVENETAQHTRAVCMLGSHVRGARAVLYAARAVCWDHIRDAFAALRRDAAGRCCWLCANGGVLRWEDGELLRRHTQAGGGSLYDPAITIP